MTWGWDYVPNEEHVIAEAPEAFIVEVEKKAEELVRAAEALYLDGTLFEGESPKGDTCVVDGGMFDYAVVPRLERVFIFQVTVW